MIADSFAEATGLDFEESATILRGLLPFHTEENSDG